ncbi:hypothetical protein [Paenibacillus sp. BJ-4]|uniref:hypothetical protein n=1 Tax=Paenibacillus sp. BJ-4 TaxID=2878097 RepID=UPI001CF09119|nr:hypothetical protein [Paenibacillus sp. BJ-4]
MKICKCEKPIVSLRIDDPIRARGGVVIARSFLRPALFTNTTIQHAEIIRRPLLL